MDNQNTFDSLFEGMDLTPEFKEQLKAVFEDAVQKKIEERKATSDVQQMAAGAALSAKRGDTPVSSLKGASKEMYKGMSEKELSDMAKVKRSKLPTKMEQVEESPELDESEEIVTLESEMEEEVVDEAEEVEMTPDDIRKILSDTDFIRLLVADEQQRGKFAAAMNAAMRDLSGNELAKPFLDFIIKIIEVAVEDSNISMRISQDLKSLNKENQSKSAEQKPEGEGETEINAEVDPEIEVFESVVESVDKYLTYVAESWVEDNKLAIEQGLKFEILESFFNGAKNLLTEHNIDVPEGKNPVEDLNAKIEELQNTIAEQKETFEAQLNEEISKTISYKNRVEKEIKSNIFESVSKDLTVVQKERFKKLVENVTFENKSSYEQNLREIAKNAFEVSTKSSKKNLTEEALNENSESGEVLAENPMMSLYANAISKNLKF